MVRQSDGERGTAIDRAMDVAVTVGVGILILVGFATSYRTLLDLAVTAGGYPRWLAPAVPLSFDLGIVVLSLKVAQAAREGRSAPVLRLLVAALSAATVVANAAAVPGPTARLLHAVPPAMFVVCFESVIITVRRHALQARGAWPEPIPRQHPLRWLLAPRSTWNCWRAAVLEDERTERPERPGHALMSLTGTNDATDASSQTPPAEAASGGEVGTPTAVRANLSAVALVNDHGLTAHQLRDVLAFHGHHVSLRTAQRLRSAALKRSGEDRQ